MRNKIDSTTDAFGDKMVVGDIVVWYSGDRGKLMFGRVKRLRDKVTSTYVDWSRHVYEGYNEKVYYHETRAIITHDGMESDVTPWVCMVQGV